uniref:Uncharacterized protein n=1 Tax=Arundo donax TaxID=35708 RepID=A0A0A9C6X3_ARUDO
MEPVFEGVVLCEPEDEVGVTALDA